MRQVAGDQKVIGRSSAFARHYGVTGFILKSAVSFGLNGFRVELPGGKTKFFPDDELVVRSSGMESDLACEAQP